jgi:FKBP-type peptidyl-prolyl cis-trans isomerase FkpA
MRGGPPLRYHRNMNCGRWLSATVVFCLALAACGGGGGETTESGLRYEVLRDGDGPKPSLSDIVTVHYRGTLEDGTVFDSSYDRNEPMTFPLAAVIPGWKEGLQLMPVGSKYKLVIPSELGYGARGAGGGQIPPHATLIFEVELLGIQ